VKVFVLSLGCAKNRVDSECLAGELERAGFTIVPKVSQAKIAIVNTCGFIQPACEESISAILDLEELKAQGKLKKIGVVGCLYNRYSTELAKELKSVDFWAKSEDWKTVLESLQCVPTCGRVRANLPDSTPYTRYLKVSEGCNNCCSYCAIPSIRGRLKSLPIKTIVAEGQKLAEEGARELCVVGQDLTVYGMDFDCGKPRLFELLDALEANLPETVRLRLLYLHPERVGIKLLERVADSKKILNYLDVPIQHADEDILVSMNRGIKQDQLAEIFAFARSLNPYFALRTTCMVGFPGENSKKFKNLLNFLEQVQFDRVGAFTYYAEEGTKAAQMEHQVPQRVKTKRLSELMALQEEISLARQEIFVGKKLEVLVEKVNKNKSAEARSYREAPEVDGIIDITKTIGKNVMPGKIINVKVTAALPHDLVAEEVLPS